MAEGGGLLNRYTLQRRIEGSNPSVSARFSGSESLGSGGARKLIRNAFAGRDRVAYPPIGPLMAPPGGGIERQFVSKLSHKLAVIH